MKFFVLPLLLAAAASAEVFQFVGQHGQESAVYGVRGAVTVGADQLTGEKTALEYNGTLAVHQTGEGEFLAKFTQFTMSKYNRINRNIKDETFGDLKAEERRLAKVLREQGVYEQEMQKPVKFYMKEGQVVRMEAGKEQHQWSLNIYRGVLTMLQNQGQKPTNLAVPHVEYKYEDGITGNCKVQYEIFGHGGYGQGVYNVTKTKNYKDCIGRPVYLHLKNHQRGCAGVCDNHQPENFLGKYLEEQTDYEMKPTPGCPVHQQRRDTLVSVQTVTKYNVSKGYLTGARSEHIDVYHLFGSKIQVFTSLVLHLHNGHVPEFQQPQNVETYETLQQRLPREQDELDIPIYALMKEHAKHAHYPQYFKKHFDAIVHELRQIQQHQKQGYGEQHGYDIPAYLVDLIQAISGMTEEEIRETIPPVVNQKQPGQLSEEEHLRRQLWIELLGKAGSKSAVKVAVEFIKKHTFTPTEVRRVLQDIGAFQSYADTDMIEQVLGLCLQDGQGGQNRGGLTYTGKTTACVAAGKLISKSCNSKVYQWAQKNEYQEKFNGKAQTNVEGRDRDYQIEPESEEYRVTTGHLPINGQHLCTPEKLQQYVDRLYQGLQQSTNFKQFVAYINGLAKIQKPEVLPKLVGYVDGTAKNINYAKEQGENEKEAVDFVRRVAILSLRDVAAKYPKEVNPIVRVIYENTTESVQTRIVAFDVWMNTQPAQWEVEKVMQVANKDTSFELTHYVYTALKTAMYAKEPCYHVLAQRIRTAWAQIRPFDFGMEFSHFRSYGYYNAPENYGIRGIWKMIASNTTIVPAYTEAKMTQVRGPYLKTLIGGKLLVKGGEKIWQNLVGKNGLLENISRALGGQQNNQNGGQQETERLFNDIAQGMGTNQYVSETPKAVIFWELFSGEAVLPIDAEYVNELKQELFQTVTKFGQQGVTGHYLRVLVPTRAFHVEPTPVGFPVVHSTIHPVVISVRYENLKFHYNNQQGRVVPGTFQLTGTVQPMALSFRQTRVFVGEKEGRPKPTMKITDIKEFNMRFNFHVGYKQPEHRFHFKFMPMFNRIFHSGHCAELKLQPNTIVGPESQARIVDYGNCVKTMYQPISRNQQIGGEWSGMVLRLAGESHEPWSGLSMFGSRDARREGLLAALINHLSNNGMKHHAISLYLEADKQQPINEWEVVIDVDSNVERLAKMAATEQTQKVQKVKVEYRNRQQPINVELQQIINKMQNLLKNAYEQIDETTYERQVLIKMEGRNQGQPKCTINLAMKKINNPENTQQLFALVAEHKESKQGLDFFGNVSYPKINSVFSYDPTYPTNARMSGTLLAKLRAGQQEQMYRANFQAVKSDEQKQESGLEWYEVRCLAEQKAGKTLTDACRKAILKDNSLDSMEMVIELPPNVQPQAKALACQALDMIKYSLYNNMQSEIVGRNQQQQWQLPNGMNEIRVSVNATRNSAWPLLYNIRIDMPKEIVTFSQVRLPAMRPVHMQLGAKDQLKKMFYPNQPDYCVAGENFVRTFDNVTFGLDVKQGCEYVLTRDQSKSDPDFTVTFKVVNPETFGKAVRVQLFNTVVEFEPFTTERELPVVFNGQRQLITFKKPLVFAYAHNKFAELKVVEAANPHHHNRLSLLTESEQFGIWFDGSNCQVHLGDRYKGKTNGICGNNDNEQHHEFIGPHGHEYAHANEFIASYGIGQGCKTPAANTNDQQMAKLTEELKQIRLQEMNKKENMLQNQDNEYNQFLMEHHSEQFWGNSRQDPMRDQDEWSGNQDQQENRQVLRTAVSIENGHICFSAKPIATCKPGYKKQGVLRTERVESICLERNNEAAIQAAQQIRSEETVNIASLEKYQKGRLFTMHSVPKCERLD